MVATSRSAFIEFATRNKYEDLLVNHRAVAAHAIAIPFRLLPSYRSRSTCRVVRDLGGLYDGRRSFDCSASPAVFRPAPCSHHRPTGLVRAFYGLDRLHMHRIHYCCHGAEHAPGKAVASRFLLLRPWAKIWTGLQRRLLSLAGTIINRRKPPCSIRSWRR
jgi:hypothetical protein